MIEIIVTVTLLTLTNVNGNDNGSADEARLKVKLVDAGGQEVQLASLAKDGFHEGDVWNINLPLVVLQDVLDAGDVPLVGDVTIRADEDDMFDDDHIGTETLDLSQDGTVEFYKDGLWSDTKWVLAYRVETARAPILTECDEQLKRCEDLTPEECQDLITRECFGIVDGCPEGLTCIDPTNPCPPGMTCLPEIP